jgi:site-specific DNA-methyltransferase (adenine-specific)
MVSSALFSSKNKNWQTPDDLYKKLDDIFKFTLDPCPNGGTDGLTRSWEGERVYCNPPYGKGIGDWLEKAKEADVAVYLLPSRTDTKWFHKYAPKANHIHFFKGRIKFKDASDYAPFPSLFLIFHKDQQYKFWTFDDFNKNMDLFTTECFIVMQYPATQGKGGAFPSIIFHSKNIAMDYIKNSLDSGPKSESGRPYYLYYIVPCQAA